MPIETTSRLCNIEPNETRKHLVTDCTETETMRKQYIDNIKEISPEKLAE